MTGRDTAKDPRNYRVGIDVGTHSVGMTAIEFDDQGAPVAILSAVSHIHDSGVLEAKTATTRRAAGGLARRTRRLLRRRSKRLRALDHTLAEWNWPDPPESTDPYAPWRARARLATEPVADKSERQALLALALRHMARHRGWRNPYVNHQSFYERPAASEFFAGYRDRVEGRLGRAFSDDVTVAELAVAAIDFDNRVPLRMGKTERKRVDRDFSYLGGKLHQADNVRELHAYASAQGLSDDLLRTLIDLVFVAESPRGSWVDKIGKDPLDGLPRAPKATPSFQRFRMVSALANVRVAESGVQRRLTAAEIDAAFAFLVNTKAGQQPTWRDVASSLGLTRSALAGTASLDGDSEERLPLRPPVDATDHVMRQLPKKLAPLRDWWNSADLERRDAFIALLTDSIRDESSPAGVEAWEVLHDLDEDALSALDGIAFPAGRAAYSITSLRKMSAHMLATGDDLHETRKSVFRVDDSWVPPAEPIGAPVGNPAVDRVTKIVARGLQAAESEWGAPSQINLEHVREAFMSESSQRERDREMRRRFEENDKQRLRIQQDEKIASRVRVTDVRRMDAITRQKGQCAYCGDTVTFTTCEMDHIVPRRGPGSTNTRSNLVAACIPCNRSKGNIPFAVWADASRRPEISVEEAVARTRLWTRDRGTGARSWSVFLKEVRERLERTEDDPEIDGRSMESVAWMANELRERIAAHFAPADTKVRVYQGAVTAGARQAAGIADRIPFIGGHGKTRLDRRHHAVDAAVVSLLDESIARTLAERNNMRVAQRIAHGGSRDWRDHDGGSEQARRRFAEWRAHMHRLSELLSDAFEDDEIVVTENLRLRLGNGRAHEDTVKPFVRRPVSGALSRDEIDAASTPALWTALTRDPDFDPEHGLPENPDRRIRIRGTHLGPGDDLEFFDKPRAAIAVRGGWAQLGDSIHHARIYRWEERGRTKYGMLRVFSADLTRRRDEDLFSVPPQPSWISMRTAHPSIGRADLDTLEYVGWLVPGDEILIDMSNLLTGHVGRASEALGLPELQRWTVAGFMHATKMSLIPHLMAAEGLPALIEKRPDLLEARDSLDYVFNRWVAAVGVLFANGSPTIIRRDALGRPRWQSHANLPVCWRP